MPRRRAPCPTPSARPSSGGHHPFPLPWRAGDPETEIESARKSGAMAAHDHVGFNSEGARTAEGKMPELGGQAAPSRCKAFPGQQPEAPGCDTQIRTPAIFLVEPFILFLPMLKEKFVHDSRWPGCPSVCGPSGNAARSNPRWRTARPGGVPPHTTFSRNSYVALMMPQEMRERW